LDTLPADVPALADGDWKFSELLKVWIGCDLPAERHRQIYEARIGAA
jgi:hypothetical protein